MLMPYNSEIVAEIQSKVVTSIEKLDITGINNINIIPALVFSYYFLCFYHHY